MPELQHFEFTENEYDGMGAARFIASRPDGWSFQTDSLGRELWLVAPEGATYDQIRGDTFFVETLDDFKAEIYALIEREKRKATEEKPSAEARLAEVNARYEETMRQYRKAQRVEVFGACLNLMYSLSRIVWRLLLMLCVVGTLAFGVMTAGGLFVALIPVWFVAMFVRGMSRAGRG